MTEGKAKSAAESESGLQAFLNAGDRKHQKGAQTDCIVEAPFVLSWPRLRVPGHRACVRSKPNHEFVKQMMETT